MRKQVDVVNQSSADTTADEVIETIHTVMHLFRARQFRALKDGAHELAHMEAKALGFFARHPGATQSDLVQHSGRDKGQIARLIGGLRERGLLDATPDEHDRRVQRLAVSSAGKAVQKALQAQSRKLSKDAVADLGDEECAQLLALLKKLESRLES